MKVDSKICNTNDGHSILVFALLAASVDRTFPRTHFKYSTGGPILLGRPFFSPFYPNGTDPQLHLGTLLRNTTLNVNLFDAAKLGPSIFSILFDLMYL